ncbi:MAG: PD40 domain-containing protein [Bacteroidetes bacterium]|nr:PD40 domain-containing protein [Bacteroidota bacterium]
MKKLFLGSMVLSLFSFAIMLFQLSCTKDASAQTTVGSRTQLNKIVYSIADYTNNVNSLWIANYDGSNATKVNFSAISGIINLKPYAGALSPDGKTLFFSAEYQTSGSSSIISDMFTANIDGSNVKKISFILSGTTLPGANAPTFSPDGKTLFFTAAGGIYSSNLDGTNVKAVVIANTTQNSLRVFGGAY